MKKSVVVAVLRVRGLIRWRLSINKQKSYWFFFLSLNIVSITSNKLQNFNPFVLTGGEEGEKTLTPLWLQPVVEVRKL